MSKFKILKVEFGEAVVGGSFEEAQSLAVAFGVKHVGETSVVYGMSDGTTEGYVVAVLVEAGDEEEAWVDEIYVSFDPSTVDEDRLDDLSRAAELAVMERQHGLLPEIEAVLYSLVKRPDEDERGEHMAAMEGRAL